MIDLFLGRSSTGEDVKLPLGAMLHHAVCLGSAGSGKTVTCKVLCEEFIRNGIPVIAVDPQGDIASLGQIADEAEVVARGTPAEVRAAYAAKVEMVVWTPGSTLGVPLSVNPLAGTRTKADGVSDEDVLRERGFAADALADLAGFDLRSAEGRAVATLFGVVMEHVEQHGQMLDGVAALVRLLEAMPDELHNRVSSIVDEKLIGEVVRRTRMLNMGAQSLLLTGGIPLDIDLLLGRGSGPTAAANGKTRLSVVYLNTLGSEREKQFFVGQLAQAVYRWMLKHPSATPQVLFYIDEVAPYLPPVRKPICKDALSLLFRQAQVRRVLSGGDAERGRHRLQGARTGIHLEPRAAGDAAGCQEGREPAQVVDARSRRGNRPQAPRAECGTIRAVFARCVQDARRAAHALAGHPAPDARRGEHRGGDRCGAAQTPGAGSAGAAERG